MSEFHDSELRQQLGELSGPFPDDNVAFAAWQRRVEQARRRRAVGWITGAAMSLIVGTVAVAALQRATGHSLVPSQSSETSAEPTTTTMPTTEARESTTTESTTTATSAPTTTLAPETTVSTAAETLPTLPEPADNPAAGGSGNGGAVTPGNNGTPGTTSHGEPGSTTETFNSAGGSITVHQAGFRLTVVGSDPAPGFRAKEGSRSGRKVEVTFRSEDQEFEITVRLVDGGMQHTVSEDSDDHQGTVPDDSSGGGDDGEGGDAGDDGDDGDDGEGGDDG